MFVLSCTQKMKSVIIWAACCSFGSTVEAPNHCMSCSYLKVICGVICKPNCDTVSCSFHIMVTPLLYWIILGFAICDMCVWLAHCVVFGRWIWMLQKLMKLTLLLLNYLNQTILVVLVKPNWWKLNPAGDVFNRSLMNHPFIPTKLDIVIVFSNQNLKLSCVLSHQKPHRVQSIPKGDRSILP